MKNEVEEWEMGIGDNFDSCADKARVHCQSHHDKQKSEDVAESDMEELYVGFDFNGVQCVVGRNTDPKLLLRDYQNSWYMEWKEIGPDCMEEYSPEIQADLESKKKAAKDAAEEQGRIQADQDEKEQAAIELKIADEPMKFVSGSGEDDWEKGLANNQDSYGGGRYEFAEYWARLMQAEAKSLGVNIDRQFMDQHASELSHQLGYMGITGFMYGAVISILSHCWKYGEVLRQWHNKEYGAEDSKGVVNPAVLSFSVKEE